MNAECGATGAIGALAVAPAGGGGGAEGGLCANATEPSATRIAATLREDGMFIGNTSCRSKATGSPFEETNEALQSPRFHGHRKGSSRRPVTAIRSGCEWIAYSLGIVSTWLGAPNPVKPPPSGATTYGS
jgi:hypothetical protein